MKHAFAWASTALIISAGLFAAPAMAQSAGGYTVETSMAVHFHDLDLTTVKGRTQLNQRVERAAARVCGYDYGQRPGRGDDEGRACYDRALRDARTTLAARQTSREVVTR